jgi:predicted cobalt transporter CbtA
LSFIALSGFGALGFYQIYKRISKKILAFVGYAVFVSAIFIIMPNNPDLITAPADLITGFRVVSIVGVSAYWLSVGIVLGVLWQKLQPDAIKQSKFQ